MSELFKTYGPGQPKQFNAPTAFRVWWQVYSEQWLDSLPAALIASGMTCQEARDYISANLANILSRTIVKAGTVIPGFPDAIVFGYNGTGSPPDYGNWQKRTDPVIDLTIDYAANIDAGALDSRATVTVDGTWVIFAAVVFASYPSTNPGSIPFDYSAWLPTVEVVTSIDVNKWFCENSNCCGSGIPIGGGSQFLIPGPDMPDPVQQNSTVPLIKTPVYLANHTWSFRNNFGRLPQ